MLVAVSGSQGSGKSTTLNALKERGYPIIERKTSRSILAEWNITLAEVNNNPTLTLDFQDEITKRKFEDEQDAINDEKIWFTERTHTDLFAYALISLGKDNSYSDWLDNYYDVCKDHNAYYLHTFYLRAGMFNVEHDGVRGSNKHYSNMVDVTMLDFACQMVDNDNLTIVNTADLDDRVSTILVSSHQAQDALSFYDR